MRLIKTYKNYFIRKKSNNAYFVFSSTKMVSVEPLKSIKECEKLIDKL
jgi:hypothetical protein